MGEHVEETVVIKMRFPKHLHEWVKKKAQKERRSFAQQIALYIEMFYEEEMSQKLNRESSDDQKAGNKTMYNKYEEKEKKIQRGDG